jgi:hypothetical protein
VFESASRILNCSGGSGGSSCETGRMLSHNHRWPAPTLEQRNGP